MLHTDKGKVALFPPGVRDSEIGGDAARRHPSTRLRRLYRGVSSPNSRSSPPGSDGDASRRPAFIVDGWDANQEAKVTLEKAKKVLQELQVDVDLDGAFVPGLSRGYIIVPMTTRPRSQGTRCEAVSSKRFSECEQLT